MMVLAGLFVFLSSMVFVIPVDNYWWVMLRSWAFQGMMLCALLAMVGFFSGYYTLGAAGLVASLLILRQLWSYLIPKPALSGDGKVFKVVHFNVLKTNHRFTPILSAAKDEDADFLSFQEVTEEWASVLKECFAGSHPFFKVVPLKSSYGMAIFSKCPLEQLQVKYWSDIPNFTGNINFYGTRFHFVTAHTRSPVPRTDYVKRNEHLREIGEYLAGRLAPGILIGDLNAVPWDQAMLRLKSVAGMKDSRKGFAPTFRFKKIPFLILPIDYILHTPKLQCLKFKVIRKSSSDHLGVTGTYYFKKLNEKS